MSVPVPRERIEQTILVIRGHRVLLDADLAELYGVETKAFNRAVTRNMERFPDDFMFRLTKKEHEDLRYHFGTSRWGARCARRRVLSSKRPYGNKTHRPPLKLSAKVSFSASTGTNSTSNHGRRFSLPSSLRPIPSPGSRSSSRQPSFVSRRSGIDLVCLVCFVSLVHRTE
jgi:ORF6N domain